MQYRRFGRTNWKVSEIGYGMWGLAGWTGYDQQEIDHHLSVPLNWDAIFLILPGPMAPGKASKFLATS